MPVSPVADQKASGFGALVGGMRPLPAPAQNHPFTLMGCKSGVTRVVRRMAHLKVSAVATLVLEVALPSGGVDGGHVICKYRQLSLHQNWPTRGSWASIRPAWRPVPGTIWSAQSIGAGGFLGRGQIRPAE